MSAILIKLQSAQNAQKQIETSIRHKIRQAIGQHIGGLSSAGNYPVVMDHFVALFAVSLRALTHAVAFDDNPDFRTGARLLLPRIACWALFNELRASGEIRNSEGAELYTLIESFRVLLERRGTQVEIGKGTPPSEFARVCGARMDTAAKRLLVEWSAHPPASAYTIGMASSTFWRPPDEVGRHAGWDRWQERLGQAGRAMSKERFAGEVLGISPKTFYNGYFGTRSMKKGPLPPVWADDHVVVERIRDLMNLDPNVWPKKEG